MVVEVSNRAGNQSNLGAAFRFEDPSTGLEALVSLATVLQCLCVARDKHLVPEFTNEWKAKALPEIIERMAADPSEGGRG